MTRRRGCPGGAARVIAAAAAAAALAALALWAAHRWTSARRPGPPPVDEVARAEPAIDYFCCPDLGADAVPVRDGGIAEPAPPAETPAGGERAAPARPLEPPPPLPVPLPPPPPAAPLADDLEELRRRRLLVPVSGISREELRDSYDDPRGAGRRHLAIDIPAPRGAPVVAVEDGTIARLFTSRLGGLTVYQFSPGGRFSYYYAHLDRYARGLEEGAAVRRGQVIAYVGTTGNAPESTPHLHFGIYRLTPEQGWWQGEPINPYLALVAPF